MSDIPPLISSTPPPMPEFDDDEDDEDDDFGMGTGIGVLSLDFQGDAALRENKDKNLERSGRTGSGSQDGWPGSNEEPDSASQDSGLCMASHDSEGVSPLPQSDDDERGATELRHSATVIFDKQHQPNTAAASNGLKNHDDDDNRSDDEFGNWTVADNIRFDNVSEPPKETKDQVCNGSASPKETNEQICNGSIPPKEINEPTCNGSAPLKEIEDLTCNGSIPNSFLNHAIKDEQPSLDSTTKTELSEIASNGIHSVDDSSVEVSNDAHSVDNECVGASDDVHPNDLQENSTETMEDNCVYDISLKGPQEQGSIEYEGNKCVNIVNSCSLETSAESSFCADSARSETQFKCEPCDNCVDDFSDSDDFGNFESVTIVNHNLSCVDSVDKHEVETNSQAVDDDSFGDFSEFSEPVIVDSKLNSNEICENDSRVVETTEEGPSLENNSASIESESVCLETVCQSEASTEDRVKVEVNHPAVSGENDDDEFDDFTDFTQSQAVENTTVVEGANDDDEFDEFSDFTQSQAVEGGRSDQDKTDNVACGSHTVSSQDSFEDIFPKEGTETNDAKTEDLGKGPIWQQLCPLESSPALRFQWPNSIAHTKLLSALNIDSRNILFGPKWNAKIPRFAANLGSNPLQPVKATEQSSVMPPTNNLPSEMTVQNEPEIVPDAHFDWVGSGLTNPLDYAHRTTVHKCEATVDNNGSKKLNKLDNLKVLSSEAEKIISQLPDLNFMKQSYIEVLISKV